VTDLKFPETTARFVREARRQGVPESDVWRMDTGQPRRGQTTAVSD
jgi:hypothetical protein